MSTNHNHNIAELFHSHLAFTIYMVFMGRKTFLKKT